MALPLIMGISVGAAVPVLLSAVGANKDGKCTAIAYLSSNILGVVFGSAVFYLLNALLNFSFIDNNMTMTTVAALNSIYRLIVVVVLFPFYRHVETVVLMSRKDK